MKEGQNARDKKSKLPIPEDEDLKTRMNVPCKSTDVFDLEYIRIFSVGPILTGSVLYVCIVHWSKVLDHCGALGLSIFFLPRLQKTKKKYCSLTDFEKTERSHQSGPALQGPPFRLV